MGLRIPPLKIKILIEPNTLKFRILVRRRLAIRRCERIPAMRPPKVVSAEADALGYLLLLFVVVNLCVCVF